MKHSNFGAESYGPAVSRRYHIDLSGIINTKLTLTDRTDVCKACGMVKDRDLNAAINLDKVGTAQPEPTDACGHDGSVLAPRSTEAEATSMDEAGS